MNFEYGYTCHMQYRKTALSYQAPRRENMSAKTDSETNTQGGTKIKDDFWCHPWLFQWLFLFMWATWGLNEFLFLDSSLCPSILIINLSFDLRSNSIWFLLLQIKEFKYTCLTSATETYFCLNDYLQVQSENIIGSSPWTVKVMGRKHCNCSRLILSSH